MELRRKELTVNELLDRFVNNRVPERLVADRSEASSTLPHVSAYPSDAYSQAIEDAERRVDTATVNTYPELDENDD